MSLLVKAGFSMRDCQLPPVNRTTRTSIAKKASSLVRGNVEANLLYRSFFNGTPYTKGHDIGRGNWVILHPIEQLTIRKQPPNDRVHLICSISFAGGRNPGIHGKPSRLSGEHLPGARGAPVCAFR